MYHLQSAKEIERSVLRTKTILEVLKQETKVKLRRIVMDKRKCKEQEKRGCMGVIPCASKAWQGRARRNQDLRARLIFTFQTGESTHGTDEEIRGNHRRRNVGQGYSVIYWQNWGQDPEGAHSHMQHVVINQRRGKKEIGSAKREQMWV